MAGDGKDRQQNGITAPKRYPGNRRGQDLVRASAAVRASAQLSSEILLALAAERADDLPHITYLAYAQAEVLADLDRFAERDGLVVDKELQRLVAGLGELDYRPHAESQNLSERQFALGEPHYQRHLQPHYPIQLSAGERGGRRFRAGLQYWHLITLPPQQAAHSAATAGIIGNPTLRATGRAARPLDSA